MRKKILIRYGEISIKGKNRDRFINRLHSRIRLKLEDVKSAEIRKVHGRIFVDYDEVDEELVFERVKTVFGIVSFSEVVETELDIKEICNAAVEKMQKVVKERGHLTFKVESRRSNKSFPLKSPEVSSTVGAAVLKNVEGVKVDVKNPDIILEVEIRNWAYVFVGAHKCLGGIPYGSSGTGLLMLSGGIDSPVSAFMMAKRGMKLEAVHFYSYPYTSERARDKVVKLAEDLCKYIGELKIHMVNIAKVQEEIHEKAPDRFMTILSRRFMVRIANKIAEDNSIQALITGESLGQVASQTIEGIVVTTDTSNIPILRPLIAFDKIDIVNISKQIGTYETSILPFEDCCTVFLPDRVATKPKLWDIADAEASLDIEEMVSQALLTKEEILVKEKKNLKELADML